jgi:hypothetical protein
MFICDRCGVVKRASGGVEDIMHALAAKRGLRCAIMSLKHMDYALIAPKLKRADTPANVIMTTRFS